MKEYRLNIGDVKTFDSPVTLTCYGLGSCVGLFLQDRTKGISGGAHILLPDEEGTTTTSPAWYNVTSALNKLIEEFQKKGSHLKTLRAKIAGGANVLNTSFNIGQRNVESLMNQLIRHKIYIAASDVGGSMSRTAKFFSEDGALLVKTMNEKRIL